MAATRTFPDEATDPGLGGEQYAERVKGEGDQLWDQVITPCGSVGGTANAITVIGVPPLIADPVDGQTFRLTPSAANTGAVTINIDSRGAIALKDVDGNALVSGDLVLGRPIDFQYDGGSSFFRLTEPTQRALLAAMASSIAGATYWTLIGDTTVAAPVTQIEHTFTVAAYSEIKIVGKGMSLDTGDPNARFRVTLRNSSAAIVTLDQATNGAAADEQNFEAVFIVNQFNDATNAKHRGRLWVDDTDTFAHGASATAPDRIRLENILGGGHTIDQGRLLTYGLKSP